MKNVLLVGRTQGVLDEASARVRNKNVVPFSATTLDEVRSVMSTSRVDIAIIGAGLDLELRIQIVRYIVSVSTCTTVHLKDVDSGPAGLPAFVERVLKGFADVSPE